MVLHLERALDLLAQDRLVEQVGDPDAGAVDLVGVRRADPAAGRSDLVLPEEPLGHLVDREWYDAITCALALTTQLGRVDASGLEPVDLGKSASGDTTTPLAMTEVHPGVRIPLGNRCVANFSPLTTMV